MDIKEHGSKISEANCIPVRRHSYLQLIRNKIYIL